MILKVRSLREMTKGELLQKKRDLEDEAFNLKMRRSLKALENPLRLRTIRREVAKILTVLREDTVGIRKLAESKTSILPQSGAGKKSE